MKFRFRIPLTASAFVIALGAGCAQQPEHADVLPGTDFSAQILADGTKLFWVGLRESPPRRVNSSPMYRREGDRREAEDGGRSRERAREIDLKKVATALLAENQYCRSGFVVLEQYPQEHGRVLRGECREAADARDRERFAR